MGEFFLGHEDFKLTTSPSLDTEARKGIEAVLAAAKQSGGMAEYLFRNIQNLGLRSKVSLLLQVDQEIFDRFVEINREYQEAARFGLEVGFTPAKSTEDYIRTRSFLLGMPKYIIEADIRMRAINLGGGYPEFLDDDLWDGDSRFRVDDGLPRLSFGQTLSYEEAVDRGIRDAAFDFLQSTYYPSTSRYRDPIPNTPDNLARMFQQFIEDLPDTHVIKPLIKVTHLVQACSDFVNRYSGNSAIERDMEDVRKAVKYILDFGYYKGEDYE